jgi:hypothetical protein
MSLARDGLDFEDGLGLGREGDGSFERVGDAVGLEKGEELCRRWIVIDD